MQEGSLGRVLALEPGVGPAANELDREGFQVQRVGEGQLALALATDETFDVALVDASMGEAAGLSLVARLREQAPSVRVVLLMTAHTNELAAQAAEAGVFQMLQKSADTSSLRRVVQAAVRARVQVRAMPLANQGVTPPSVIAHLDELTAQMRVPASRGAARGIFAATAQELGEAAVAGAVRRGA